MAISRGVLTQLTPSRDTLCGRESEASMDGNLEEEREGLLKWLFDVLFGRRSGSEGEIGSAIHRLGSVNGHLKEND